MDTQMNISQKLAEKMRMLREINNYTQEHIANVLNVSPNTYSLMEKGTGIFSLDRIEKLAELYHMTITDFLQLNDQTIINHITNSNNVGGSENVNILHAGVPDEERSIYKETITKLEELNGKLTEQNGKLIEQITQQNDKLMILFDKISDKLS